MPEDKNCKLLQPSRTTDGKKKKKKKRKKVTAPTTPPENTEKPQAVSETSPASLLPQQSPVQPRAQLPKLRAASKKDRERLAGSGQRSKTHPKDSSALLTTTTTTNKTGGGGELSAQARESLRWEGVLEDPQAEEKRLELYRANRRHRYIAHRDALLKETLGALRQTFPTESKEKKALTGSDQQESLLHLSKD